MQSKSYGALAYDRENHKSCGLSVFRTDSEKFGSVSSSATVPGCGFHGTNKGCVCVSGDDQILYTQAPAFAILDGLNDEVELKESMETQLGKHKTNVFLSYSLRTLNTTT